MFSVILGELWQKILFGVEIQDVTICKKRKKSILAHAKNKKQLLHKKNICTQLVFAIFSMCKNNILYCY